MNDLHIKTLKTKENNVSWYESLEPYVDKYEGKEYIFCEGTEIDEGRHLFTVDEYESHNIDVIQKYGSDYYTLILKAEDPNSRSFLVFDNNSCSEGKRYYEITNFINENKE